MPDTTPATDWRAAITALCGGDDLGAMIRWITGHGRPHEWWHWKMLGESRYSTTYASVSIKEFHTLHEDHSFSAECATPEEALAVAVLKAIRKMREIANG